MTGRVAQRFVARRVVLMVPILVVDRQFAGARRRPVGIPALDRIFIGVEQFVAEPAGFSVQQKVQQFAGLR